MTHVEHRLQSPPVKDTDLATVHVDQPIRLQIRQCTCHGLQLHREEVSKVGAGHAEQQVAAAEPEPFQPVHEVEQKRDDALLGAERAQVEHPCPVAA